MPEDGQPRWRRRKTARPGEMVEAALTVFAEKGFAAAKLEEIARLAGVSKAAVYLYFETKEELFRAAARSAVGPALSVVEQAAEDIEAPFAQLVPLLLAQAAGLMAQSRAGALARIVITEARTFPDLAEIWRQDVVERVIGLVARLIAKAQARGEVRAGDPRLMAFSLMGPMVMGLLYRVVFGEVESAPDLAGLAAEQTETALRGLLAKP